MCLYLFLFSILNRGYEVIEAGILGKRRDDKYATTENRNVLYRDTVFMYIIMEMVDGDNDTIYLTNYSRKKIEVKGRTVPQDRILLFDEFFAGYPFLFYVEWKKVESVWSSYSNFCCDRIEPDSIVYSDTTFTVKNLFDTSGTVADPSSRFPLSSPVKLPDFLGTMRYSFTIHRIDILTYKEDIFYEYPWQEHCHLLGIDEEVYRVSYRLDNTVTGWATSFFNLPYIFVSLSRYKNVNWDTKEIPSNKHQAERYIGADCADFVTFAWRRYEEQRNKKMMDYGYSAKFIIEHKVLFYPEEIEMDYDGFFRYNGEKIRFISDSSPSRTGLYVKPGDIMVFGARRGDLKEVWHSAMLFMDRGTEEDGKKGYLDKDDLLVEIICDIPHILEVSLPDFTLVRVED